MEEATVSLGGLSIVVMTVPLGGLRYALEPFDFEDLVLLLLLLLLLKTLAFPPLDLPPLTKIGAWGLPVGEGVGPGVGGGVGSGMNSILFEGA